MNFVYSVSWKVYCKKSKKLIACVLEGDKPLTIKNRGRWWVFFGSTGFQRCDFNFEECKEYVIIEWLEKINNLKGYINNLFLYLNLD